MQEGITDYYARRLTREYFGEANVQYQTYIIDKYISAMRLETSDIPPSDLLVGSNPTLNEVSNRCFGKGVFLVDALASAMNNDSTFDRVVSVRNEWMIYMYT